MEKGLHGVWGSVFHPADCSAGCPHPLVCLWLRGNAQHGAQTGYFMFLDHRVMFSSLELWCHSAGTFGLVPSFSPSGKLSPGLCLCA